MISQRFQLWTILAVWAGRICLVAGLLLAGLAGSVVNANDENVAFFESKVRPILIERCYKCHSSESGKTHGGLGLDTRQGWEKGGDSGPAIVPGKVEESLLLKAIGYEDSGLQMPPEESGGKLPAGEIAILTEWVKRGAADPRVAAAKLGGMTLDEAKHWWSLQPVAAGKLPAVKDAKQVLGNIDYFVQARLEQEGLAPLPMADKRTLLRRVTYDLTGLPPTMEELQAFLGDESPEAFRKVVERLLQSPAYGERWGRHWLDLVRYADTAGENTDHPIQDAWRYRNWVIRAFQKDLPYDKFLQDQIAGDLIHAKGNAEEYADGVVATGFLAIARRFDHDIEKHMHLTNEDTIDTLCRSVLGLSVACARCHDHKYDPISTQDYYALYGIFQSTKFAFPGCEPKQQPRDMVPLLSPEEWKRVVEPHLAEVAKVDAQMQQLKSQMAEISTGLAKQEQTPVELAKGDVAEGGESVFGEAEALKAVPVRRGDVLKIEVFPQDNHGADSTLLQWNIQEIGGSNANWNASEDAMVDFLGANPHADRRGNSVVWWYLDGREPWKLMPESIANDSGQKGLHVWRNGDTPSIFVNSSEQPIKVWTTLPAKSLFVHPAPNGPVAVAWVSPMDGTVAINGKVADAHPGGPNGVSWKLTRFSATQTEPLTKIAEINKQLAAMSQQKAKLLAEAPKQETAYAVMEGTIANAKQHLRGDPEKLGPEIPRHWLTVMGGDIVPTDAGSGRLQLAKWLTDAKNPLTARVMVNRIWQHHMGKGIVASPNDFGSRGIKPTHPELLDYLADQFVKSGWSVKAVHREILLSAVYQRASVGENLAALEKDPSDDLYWRFSRRRISAEELRDSLLMASGDLDRVAGEGHPFPPTNTWTFTQHNPFSAIYDNNKRSVYLMTLRNRRHPFLGLFDGADPNASTPQRQITTVPTQALYFMNDPFFHAQANKLADRALQQPSDAARCELVFQAVLQRTPTAHEQQMFADFVKRYETLVPGDPAKEPVQEAWRALVRVILTSNEFLYVE